MIFFGWCVCSAPLLGVAGFFGGIATLTVAKEVSVVLQHIFVPETTILVLSQ